MPIYEYECAACGRIDEVIQKFSDKPLKTCRHCSGKLQKLVSQSSFHLKGNGWYVTDYANRSASSASSGSPAKPPAAKCSTEKAGDSPKTPPSSSSKN